MTQENASYGRRTRHHLEIRKEAKYLNEKYNALFTPWKVGNVEIPNRIVQ